MPNNQDAVLNFKFDAMSNRLQVLEMAQAEDTAKSERAGVAFTGRIYLTIADLPLAAQDNLDFSFGFLVSGRKSGETAGNGTGIFAMYNPATDSWLNVADYSAVTE